MYRYVYSQIFLLTCGLSCAKSSAFGTMSRISFLSEYLYKDKDTDLFIGLDVNLPRCKHVGGMVNTVTLSIIYIIYYI